MDFAASEFIQQLQSPQKSFRQVQGYFPVAGKELEIRLRYKGVRYFLTIKVGQGSVHGSSISFLTSAAF